MEKVRGNVLVVEDDADCGRLLTEFLTFHGYGVRWVQSRDAAVTALRRYLYDHIILDVSMRGMTLEGFFNDVRLDREKVVLMSAICDPKSVASTLGLTHWLKKPFDPHDLLDIFKSGSTPIPQAR